jgi:hypothetical protein
MKDMNVINSTDTIRNTLNFQFDIAWQLLEYHLNGLEDEECLWKPSTKGLHVANESGIWHADWPETEGYEIGPPNIAWTTWHIIFWWSMTLDYSFGNGTLKRENVQWPGTMEAVKERITELRDQWKTAVAELSDDEFLACERTKWPFEGKPFYEVAAWLNVELMKNASEIGYCRFLYGSQKHQ